MRTVSAYGDVKPQPWLLQPQRVAREWRSLYRGLAFAFLYWHGDVIDLMERARPNSATVGNGSSIVTPYGRGIDHTGRMEFDSFSPMNPGTGAVTVLTYCNANATDRQTLVCQRVGNQDNHLEIRVGQKFVSSTVPGNVETVSGHLFFQCDDGSTAEVEGASTLNTTPVDGGWHVFAGRRTASGVTSVWSDGEDVTDANQNDNTEDVGDAGTFVLGGLPGTATIAYQDDKLLDVGWNRDLSDREMQMIGRDPFGPFRPATRRTIVTGAPSTPPIAVFMHHYRQQG